MNNSVCPLRYVYVAAKYPIVMLFQITSSLCRIVCTNTNDQASWNISNLKNGRPARFVLRLAKFLLQNSMALYEMVLVI